MISRRSSGIAKRSRVSGFSVPHVALLITRFIGSVLAVSPASPNTSLLPFQAGWFFLLLRGILFRAFYILGSCAVCQTASSFSIHYVRIRCGQSQLPRFPLFRPLSGMVCRFARSVFPLLHPPSLADRKRRLSLCPLRPH